LKPIIFFIQLLLPEKFLIGQFPSSRYPDDLIGGPVFDSPTGKLIGISVGCVHGQEDLALILSAAAIASFPTVSDSILI
jgi:hypothetical protein